MSTNVLLVDDSLSVRVNLQHALMAAGFSVTACENGALARRAIRSGAFNLIILDVILPDANGIEIAQEARAYPPTAKAPIIMLSSEADVQHRIRGFAAGASEYIGKPYGASYVVKRVKQLTDMRSSSPSVNAAPTGPLRILLVDDSPTFLNAFADRLRVDGHDVILAKSGSEALSFLAVQPVDGVVLDVFMPGISGLETCRRIKNTPTWADIPVMMLTGREDSVAKATGITSGVDDYLVKSPDIASMVARLSELLRKRRQDRSRGSARGPDSPRDSVRAAQLVERTLTTARGPDSSRSDSSAGRLATPSSDRPGIGRGPDSVRGDSSRFTPSPADRSSSGARGPDSARVPIMAMPPPSSEGTAGGRAPESPRTAACSSPLFEQVLAVCGLPQFIGRSSLRRALDRAGVDVAALTPASLMRALPELRQTLGVFLPAPEIDKYVAAIGALARKAS